MKNKNLSARNIARYFIIFSVLTTSQWVFSKEITTENTTHNPGVLTPVIVLDLEMLGDTSVDQLKQNDELLLHKFSKFFRRQLNQQSVFDVIADKQSMAVMKDKGQHQFLHRCNGCEFDLGKQLGAKQVVVPWIFRMSILIQTLVIEIREVETGRLILKRPYNFRGNTDKAWERTIRYAIKDLKKTFREDAPG